jgi:hypothetical protein
MKREQLEKLASEKGNPCVTISMNTHRTHPDNAEDNILHKRYNTPGPPCRTSFNLMSFILQTTWNKALVQFVTRRR